MLPEWVPIRGYEHYAVNDHGQVLRVTGRSGATALKCIKACYAGKGYLMVGLRDAPRARKFMYVHRLVAQHFVAGESPGLEVNHKDGNKENNHKDNLEWGTHAENVEHATRTGLVLRGERNPRARLSHAQAVEARARTDNGERHEDVAQDYGVCRATISLLHERKNWRHL